MDNADRTSLIRDILAAIGIEPGFVRADSRIRADLGLDSTETTQLEIELRERFATGVDLWDSHDYSVAELAGLLPDR